ncbi:glycosyltransferase [Candidatus Parcubacteria bacterium]|nr:MAG: glycosyltransferase [Candidatus Parcubacteria bacterium]
MTDMTVPRGNVLGVGISLVDMERAIQVVESWLRDRDDRGRYVCVTGMHGVMESQKDPAVKAIHNRADLVVPDGMSVVWTLRWFGHPEVGRVCGPDFMLALCRRLSERKIPVKHYFYGGAPGVWERLAQPMQAKVPGMEIVGGYCPPFRPLTPEEDEAVIHHIMASGADIVWVGLSTPKQEKWMAEHVDRLPGKILIGVGAAFDFHAGLKKRAPRWMQMAGLEWLYRLLQEPRRLWRRYLLNIPQFVWLVARQKWSRYEE